MDGIINPQNQATEQPQQYQESQQPPQGGEYTAPVMTFRPKSKGKGILIAIIILVILGIIGAGSALAFRIWDPVWNPFRPSPDKVISAMLAKMPTIKISHQETDINLKVNGQYSGNLAVNTVGDFDMTDINNPKAQGDLTLTFTGDPFNTGSQSTESVKVSAKVIGKDVYLNLEDVSSSLEPFLAMAGIDISSIKGAWIKVPESAIQQYASQQNSSQINISAPQITPAERAKIQSMISQSKIYNVKEQLPDKTINGQKVYDYMVSVDNDKTAKLIGDLIDEGVSQTNQAQSMMAAGIVKGMASEILDKIGEIDVELLIGMNDSLLYGFKTAKSLDIDKTFGTNGFGTLAVAYDMSGSKFNQPANIQAPANAQNLEDMPIYKEAMLKNKDSQIESYMYSLPALAAQSHDKNGNYLSFSCQNEDIKSTCDKIKAITGEDIVIHQSKNYYCIYVKLLETVDNETQYQCLNVLGAESITTTDPGGPGYCGKKTFKCPPGISTGLIL